MKAEKVVAKAKAAQLMAMKKEIHPTADFLGNL